MINDDYNDISNPEADEIPLEELEAAEQIYDDLMAQQDNITPFPYDLSPGVLMRGAMTEGEINPDDSDLIGIPCIAKPVLVWAWKDGLIIENDNGAPEWLSPCLEDIVRYAGSFIAEIQFTEDQLVIGQVLYMRGNSRLHNTVATRLVAAMPLRNSVKDKYPVWLGDYGFYPTRRREMLESFPALWYRNNFEYGHQDAILTK